MADACGGRLRGRPRLGWMEGVKMTLGSRGMTAEKIGRCGEPWCICRLSSNAAMFAWPCVLSDSPPTLGWFITWRWVGCR